MSKNKNKREKKGYLEFFIVILISALFGGVGAVILEIYDKDVKSIGNLLEDVIGQGAFWVICFLSVVGSLVNIYMVWAVRKRCRTWDGEDDEAAEEIERYNSRCQGVIACCTTIVMVLSGVNIVYIFHRTENMRNIGIMCILFVSYSLWSAFAQNILVEFSKKMNPEKKGNALSLHFTRDWDNSCDVQSRLCGIQEVQLALFGDFYFFTDAFSGCGYRCTAVPHAGNYLDLPECSIYM